MVKWLLVIICVGAVKNVFSEPGYEVIRDENDFSQRSITEAPKTVVRRRRHPEDTPFEIIFPEVLEIFKLQNKETKIESKYNILSKYNEQCKNGQCEGNKNHAPLTESEDRTVRNTGYYDYSNTYYEREEYPQYSEHRPPPPPPPPPHYGPPPPPHHYHEGPPHHHRGPPHHHGGPPHHDRGPPPPPPPPPPPHHNGSPSSRHFKNDYRLSYYEQNSQENDYNRRSIDTYEKGYRSSEEDRRTRQSPFDDNPYYDRRPPPPPHHSGPQRLYRGAQSRHDGPPPRHFDNNRPPPRHHGPPPPPPGHEGPPDGGPRPRRPHDGPPARYSEEPPPDLQDQNMPEPYDDSIAEQPFNNHPTTNENQQVKETQSKINDRLHNIKSMTDPVSSSDSPTVIDQNDNSEYPIDVRFADETPEQTTKSAGHSEISTRLSPYLFQAVAVTPEDE